MYTFLLSILSSGQINGTRLLLVPLAVVHWRMMGSTGHFLVVLYDSLLPLWLARSIPPSAARGWPTLIRSFNLDL